jgi:type III pantothenate kinase
MLQNLILDIGNTFVKSALFRGEKLIFEQKFSHEEWENALQNMAFDRLILSDVSRALSGLIVQKYPEALLMSASLKMPFTHEYRTPQTLGTDRIAAAAGAFAIFPSQSVLCIDAGTCITYDFIRAAGVYEGGSISPGLRMRFRALHEFTGRLPMIEAASFRPELIGKSTQEAILSGVMNGFLSEIKGITEAYMQKKGKMITVVCGGDGDYIAREFPEFRHVPDLVLRGLNEILKYN